MTAIGLRTATSADREYCFQLHKAAAMGAYITAIWGWDEEVQRDFHACVFTPDRWQIIGVDGTEAGMLHVEHRPTGIYLARIELRAAYTSVAVSSGQRCGCGSGGTLGYPAFLRTWPAGRGSWRPAGSPGCPGPRVGLLAGGFRRFPPVRGGGNAREGNG